MSFFNELKRRNVFRVGIAYGVATWLLIQVTDIVFPRIGLPDSAVTLVIALLAIGFIPAMIFAWAFEMTPEGIKREKDVDATRSITPHTGKRLDRLIIAGLVLVIAGMGVERAWFAGEKGSEPFSEPIVKQTTDGNEQKRALTPFPGKSVAVLPFTSMSSGEDDGYFADGLTEEILNSLAALPELLVTARTSSFHFKGKNLPIQEIASTLGVDHIVEGSVRRSGERVRITAQLIRTNDGFHLWSNTYDRTLEDVFAVQEDIAENIAQTLDIVLDEEKRAMMRKSGIGNVEAFIAYQKGLEVFGQAHQKIETTAENLKIAVEHFDTALATSPDLVAARIMKADQRGHVIFELASGIREEAFEGELAEALADLREEYALAIQASPPGNQRNILELEAAIFSDDWSDMQLRIQRALQPGGCPSMNWSVDFVVSMGQGVDFIEKIRDILRCDPFNFVGIYGLSGALLAGGDPIASMEASGSAIARGVTFIIIEEMNFLAHLAAGKLDAPEVLGPGSDRGLLLFPRQLPRQLLLGNSDAALRMAEEYWASPDSNDWASMIVAAMIGDRERANKHAARIDSRPGSAIVLTNGTHICACGAPFDLEATPNLKARLEESGFDWSPSAAIRFPAKDW